MTVATTTEVLNAIRGYVWAALAAVVLWKLYPQLKAILEKRGFKIRAFGAELTVQDASDQLQELVASLQKQVADLRERLGDAPGETVEPELPPAERPSRLRTPTILWVDDRPENNALLMKTVHDYLRTKVTTATSTAQALQLHANEEFDLVISDMGRNEDGRFKSDAGIALIQGLRDARSRSPVVVYASDRAVNEYGEAALKAGASLVTASRSELLSRLRVPPTTQFEADVADDLERLGYDVAPTVLRGTVDFVVRRNGVWLGVEVKNWKEKPPEARLRRAFADSKRAMALHGLAGVVVVHRPDIEVDIEATPTISVVPRPELGAALAKLARPPSGVA